MKCFAFAAALLAAAQLGACESSGSETAEAATAAAQCKAILKHIVEITPQGRGKDPEHVVAALPIEDMQACIATEPAIRDCLASAATVTAVKLCTSRD